MNVTGIYKIGIGNINWECEGHGRWGEEGREGSEEK